MSFLLSRLASGRATAGAAIFCGVAGGACLKMTVATPSPQILLERSAIAAAALIGYLLIRAPARLLKPIGAVAFGRAVLDAVAAFTFALAIFELPLSLLTALHLALPITSSLLAIPLLGERLSGSQGFALALGFCGVLIILRPGLDASVTGVVLALASTVCYALRDIMTRRLPADTDTLGGALLAIILVGAAALLMPSDRAWLVPPPPEIVWAVMSAVFFLGANVLIVHSLRQTSIGQVAPLRYMSILWAILFDIALWGTAPDITTMFGAGIIIGAGLWLLPGNAGSPDLNRP